MASLRRSVVSGFALWFIPLCLTAAELSFVVEDSRKTPVPAAVIEIQPSSSGAPVAVVRTDDQGRASRDAVLPVTVRVHALGFETMTREIASQPPAAVYLKLVPDIFRVSVDVLVKDTPRIDGPLERNALTIERSGARTVYDAVDKLIPSAYVPSRGILGHGLGISNSIALRGMGGSPTTQLLMVVDDRPDVMGLMGHPIPDFYSLTDVGSLSVTPGPASVLYGNRAMGGVIEVRPAEPEPGFHTDLSAGLGSYYTGQDRLTHSGRFDRFQYLFAAGIEHTNGHRENSGFRNQDGTLRMAYDLTPAWKTTVGGRYGHFTVEDPGTVESPTPGSWARVGRGGYSVGLENRTERTHGSVHFFSSYGHHMLSDGFRSVDGNVGFRLRQTFDIGSDFGADVGGDVSRYGGSAGNIQTAIDFGEHHMTEGGGFGRLRYEASGRLRINAGFRYDRNSGFGGVAAAEFGASYRFAPDFAVSAAVARGFRNPTIRELYLFPAPTPTLQPEHMWNYQASFQARPIAGLLVWVTGYYSDVENLIVTTGRYPNLVLQNTGHASNRGLEINGRWRITRYASLSSGYAWFDSNNRAPYVPGDRWIYSVDVDLVRAFVTFSGSVVGSVKANAAGTVMLDGYAVSTLRCTVPVGRRWSVFATVDNLFDRRYRELAGYPMPGTNASGGFHVRF